jgi:hypothetical protein
MHGEAAVQKGIHDRPVRHLEPLRVSRRLQLLRGWSHDEANPTLLA